MSEYQYYEFVAIDRPLTERQMRELRACSTRATITPTRFVNTYDWGGLKADPAEWMEKYFDAFLHDTNWGSRTLMFRLPRRLFDLRTARRYCRGGPVSARARGEFVVLEFSCDDEERQEDEGSEGWLASLIPLRAEIAGGDNRALYLAWLRCVQTGELEGRELEPPCPLGLKTLSAPLGAFAEFLRIDLALLAVAAERSRSAAEAMPRAKLRRWVAGLPENEKTGALADLIRDDAPLTRARLLNNFRKAVEGPDRLSGPKQRRVGMLRAAARQLATQGFGSPSRRRTDPPS